MLKTTPLAAGTWTFDPNHSGVHFKVRHLGLTNVRGRFNGVDASLVVGDDLGTTRFEATIQIGTIDTNQAAATPTFDRPTSSRRTHTRR